MEITEATKITRPALRYFGGKFRLANWIIEEMPAHICYVEPFGGAMGVMLRKPPAVFEIYNDLDGEVVNFFKMLREQPDELLRLIALTPYSREEQRQAFEEEEISDIERARRLYVRCWQSHGGGRTQWRTGWRYQVSVKRGRSQIDDWNMTDHLWPIINRIKKIQIEHADAIDVIKRFDRPDTLFYIDPPYLQSERSHVWAKAYQYEIGDDYHLKLGETLNNVKGMAMISGKPSPVYDELFKGWGKKQKTVPTDFQSSTVECLWISPRAMARRGQLSLGGI